MRDEVSVQRFVRTRAKLGCENEENSDEASYEHESRKNVDINEPRKAINTNAQPSRTL